MSGVTLKSGFLQKKVPLRRNLHKRWFVLFKNELVYFKDQPTKLKGQKPLSIIQLEGCSVSKLREEQVNKISYFSFELVHPDRGSVWLASEMEDDGSGWVSILEDTIVKLSINPISSKMSFSVDPLNEYKLEGYLDKRSYQNTMNWKRRYFVLNAKKMSYYKNQFDKNVVGNVLLSTQSQVSRDPDSGRPNSFILQRQGQRSYILSSESHGEMEAWVNSLEKIIEWLNTQKRSRVSVYAAERKCGLNFETYRAKNAKSSEEISKSLLHFPEADVKVSLRNRDSKTLYSSVPSELIKDKDNLPQHIRDCISIFTRPLTIIEYADRSQYGTGKIIYTPPRKAITLDPISDIDETNNSAQPIDILKEWAGEMSPNDAKSINGLFLNDRQNIIQLFCADIIQKLPETDLRMTSLNNDPYSSEGFSSTKLYIEVEELSFDIGNIEPMFGSMCLFDIEQNVKLSETYSFNTNTEEMIKKISLMDLSSTKSDPTTLTTKALFTLSARLPSIYLMVRVEKVLRGDPELFYDVYQRGAMKPKKVAKYSVEIDELCAKFGDYRQPFVWTAIPLFDNQNQFLYDKEEQVLELYRFPKDIGDEYLSERIQAMNQKKFKPLPGKLVVKIKILKDNENLPNLVDPALNPIVDPELVQEKKNTPGSRHAIFNSFKHSSLSNVIDSLSSTSIIREIREFPVYSTLARQPPLIYFHDLYVYPRVANFTNLASANRTITLEVALLDSDEYPPSTGAALSHFEKSIYGKSCCTKFTDNSISCVTYHNKRPQFYDEIKIKLPAILSPAHHLLFTIKHVTISKKNPIPDELIGYCVLPLINENSQMMIGSDIQLNAYSELPQNYIIELFENIKTVGSRPALDLKLKLNSTIWAHDPFLQNFFYLYSSMQEHGSNQGSNCFDTEGVCRALRSLPNTSIEVIFHFLPLILDELFNIISFPFPSISIEAFWCLINILIHVVQNQSGSTRQHVLESYVTLLFQNGYDVEFAVFEEICFHWASVLVDKPRWILPSFLEDMCKFSWFLFEVTTKSMVLKLHSSKLLGKQMRDQRFSSDFCNSLDELLTNLLTVVQVQVNSDKEILANQLNSDIAYFFKDIINIMDRGIVLDLIGKYVKDLNPNRNASLEKLKFQFLGIICDHEYYIPLNIPIKDEIDKVTDLSNRLWEKHFLVGLILHELLALQLSPESFNRKIGIEFLRNLLLRHALDPRYQIKEKQMRIAGLYFPYLLNVIEDKTRAVLSFDDLEEKKNWLICFLHLLKTSDEELLRCWFQKETQSNLRFLFAILNDCLDTFEVPITDPDLSVEISVRGSILLNKRTGFRRDGVDKQALFRQSGLNTQSMLRRSTVIRKNIPNIKKQQDLIIYKEISFIVLNTLMNFFRAMEVDLREENSDLMENAISTLILLMKKQNQTISFTRCLLLNSLVLISKYPEVFFIYQNNFCGQLVYELFRHCCYCSNEIRSLSLTILFDMFLINFETTKGNIVRMKHQSIICISKLIGEGSKQYLFFKSAISTLEKQSLTLSDAQLKDLMSNLTNNLLNILEKSLKIRECDFDSESTAYYYYQIIRSYEDAPELQVAWLESLSQIHLTNENIEEAAQCNIQQSAIIVALLQTQNLRNNFPLNLNIYLRRIERISPNIGKEFSLPNNLLLLENGAISGLNQDQLFHLLTLTMEQFKQINMFEHATDIGRLLAHIYQSRGNYDKAHLVYSELQQLCEEIINLEQSKSRSFPKFYLVSFYGKRFGDREGKSFIYKEQPFVTLQMMINKLKLKYEAHFGLNTVDVINTNNTKQVEIAPNKLTIQIAKVHKYFKSENNVNRSSDFDRNFNVQQFIVESEFVPWLNNSAKPRPPEPTPKKGLLAVAGTRSRLPSVADKQLLKVLLTTEFSFPCLRKCLEVIQKDQWVLSPIQNSIEILVKQSAKLRDVLNIRPTSLPRLQHVLNLTLFPSPDPEASSSSYDVCALWLGCRPPNRPHAPSEELAELEVKARAFLKLTKMALSLHKSVIDSSQISKLQDYEKQFVQIAKILDNYVPQP